MSAAVDRISSTSRCYAQENTFAGLNCYVPFLLLIWDSQFYNLHSEFIYWENTPIQRHSVGNYLDVPLINLNHQTVKSLQESVNYKYTEKLYKQKKMCAFLPSLKIGYRDCQATKRYNIRTEFYFFSIGEWVVKQIGLSVPLFIFFLEHTSNKKVWAVLANPTKNIFNVSQTTKKQTKNK